MGKRQKRQLGPLLQLFGLLALFIWEEIISIALVVRFGHKLLAPISPNVVIHVSDFGLNLTL